MFKFIQNNKKLIISFLFLISISMVPSTTMAANLKDAFKPNSKEKTDIIKTVADGAGYTTVTTDNAPNDLNSYIGMIIQTLLSILGVFFLCLMLYGGFLWMSDMGNSDKVKKSKELMTAAVIGLIIVLASYAISYFIIDSLGATTLSTK
jgi:hypothetical protein